MAKQKAKQEAPSYFSESDKEKFLQKEEAEAILNGTRPCPYKPGEVFFYRQGTGIAARKNIIACCVLANGSVVDFIYNKTKDYRHGSLLSKKEAGEATFTTFAKNNLLARCIMRATNTIGLGVGLEDRFGLTLKKNGSFERHDGDYHYTVGWSDETPGAIVVKHVDKRGNNNVDETFNCLSLGDLRNRLDKIHKQYHRPISSESINKDNLSAPFVRVAVLKTESTAKSAVAGQPTVHRSRPDTSSPATQKPPHILADKNFTGDMRKEEANRMLASKGIGDFVIRSNTDNVVGAIGTFSYKNTDGRVKHFPLYQGKNGELICKNSANDEVPLSRAINAVMDMKLRFESDSGIIYSPLSGSGLEGQAAPLPASNSAAAPHRDGLDNKKSASSNYSSLPQEAKLAHDLRNHHYQPNYTRQSAESALANSEPGSYLTRPSSNASADFALSAVILENGKKAISHISFVKGDGSDTKPDKGTYYCTRKKESDKSYPTLSECVNNLKAAAKQQSNEAPLTPPSPRPTGRQTNRS